MPAPRKTPKTPEQRIADLERELRLRDERIGELKDEIDESRELVREMEEHAQETTNTLRCSSPLLG
jgi:predicted  nucleic acid-binding Zn-ribbon protein